MGQDQILLIGGAQFVEGVSLGQIRHRVHLIRRDVARHAPDRLQRHHHRGIARLPVPPHIVPRKPGEVRIGQQGAVERGTDLGQVLERRRGEIGLDPLGLVFRDPQIFVAQGGVMLVHLLAEGLQPHRSDQDLDPRLMDIVAPPQQVPGPQDGGQIGQQVRRRHGRSNLLADMGQTPLPPADEDAEGGPAVLATHDLKPHVMGPDRRPILLGADHRDLELARQEAELRMDGRPLADDLAPGARILDLVVGRPGEDVGRGVADAVARGLDGVHLDIGQVAQDRRQVGQGRPVVLDVRPRGEMAVALVIGAGDMGQLAHLPAVERPIRNGDPQHIGVQLQIDPVHQPQRLELVLGQGAGRAARHLVREFLDPFTHQGVVELVITIHQADSRTRLLPTVGPVARIRSFSRSRPEGVRSCTSTR